MQVLIACDKFKGSLSARTVCHQIALGIQESFPDAKCLEHPMADGGDGSLDILEDSLGAHSAWVEVEDPLGRPVQARYLLSENKAYVELAEASGITLLKKAERNPLRTTTVGTGQVILDALKKGVKEVYLFLGGSCTTDVGLGIAHALGFRFLDRQGKELVPRGGNLSGLATIQPPDDFPSVKWKILCDVNNPLYGPKGAAHVFGPQKGASPEMVDILDKGLRQVAELIQQTFGVDISEMEGGGAAGGIAAGLYGLLGAEILNGFDTVSALTELGKEVAKADVVVTGEGRLDTQSLDGKVVGKLAEQCVSYSKPLFAIVGVNELSKAEQQAAHIQQVLEISSLAKDEQDAFEQAGAYVFQLAKHLNLPS